MGAFGGAFSLLEIVASRFPNAAQDTPDWLIGFCLIATIGVMGFGWTLLDMLAKRRPVLGRTIMVLFALASIVVGLGAAFWGPWGVMGWFAALGGAFLLAAAYLSYVAGGTEPLTWRSLHTERILAAEARIAPVARGIIGLVAVLSFILTIVAAIDGQDWWTLGILALVALLAGSWLLVRR